MKTTELELRIGDKVHYQSFSGSDRENGVVKSLHPTNKGQVFVVYKCGGNWDKYQNYTAACTNLCDLRKGWI